ncbi:MAG: hydantoinase B/oxoprolinase family protein [Owenweeksia sp.]|nr:hydantoinase B/oxoprolinase family protein [Owenweeksia sp.]
MTDPEIMELRYPVRVQRFAIRRNSGGPGKWRGGDGVIRELKFLDPVTLTVLTQHRKVRPYGLKGGEIGQPGRQFIIRIKWRKAST